MDEDGKTVAENGTAFKAYGLQTTVLYVKLMLLEPGQESTAFPTSQPASRPEESASS